MQKQRPFAGFMNALGQTVAAGVKVGVAAAATGVGLYSWVEAVGFLGGGYSGADAALSVFGTGLAALATTAACESFGKKSSNLGDAVRALRSSLPRPTLVGQTIMPSARM